MTVLASRPSSLGKRTDERLCYDYQLLFCFSYSKLAHRAIPSHDRDTQRQLARQRTTDDPEGYGPTD